MRIVTILSIMIFIFACTKDPIEPIDLLVEDGIFICNEGNFTFGNASLSFYDPQTNQVLNQVFYDVNNFPIGDVLNSIHINDSLAFLVVNASGKIHVINKKNFKHKKTITGLNSPRNIAFDGKYAFVSELYGHFIHRIDLQTLELDSIIPFPGVSDEIIIKNNILYTNSWNENDKIYRMNLSNYSEIDSLKVGFQPLSIQLDKHDNLYVISDGGNPQVSQQEAPSVSIIDLNSWKVSKTIRLNDPETTVTNLSSNPAKDSIFFGIKSFDPLEVSGIYHIDTDTRDMDMAPFIETRDLNINYIQANTLKDIYISNPGQFISSGEVYRFRRTGIPIDTLMVDIIPAHILPTK